MFDVIFLFAVSCDRVRMVRFARPLLQLTTTPNTRIQHGAIVVATLCIFCWGRVHDVWRPQKYAGPAVRHVWRVSGIALLGVVARTAPDDPSPEWLLIVLEYNLQPLCAPK